MWVKAVYRVHSIKHIFLVVESSTQVLPPESEIKKEDFERILLDKYCTQAKERHHWITKVIQEYDFLESLRNQELKRLVSTNLSSENPENMELLSINLLKTHEPHGDSLSLTTPKVLRRVSQEDIIEVFL